MSNLYRDADWSQKDLDKQISEARKHMTKCKINSLSLEYLKYYKKQLSQRKKEGHKTSFIDLWSLVLESFLHDGVQYVIKQLLQWLTVFWKLISGEDIFLLVLIEVVGYKTVWLRICKCTAISKTFGGRHLDVQPWWKSASLLVRFWICFCKKTPRLTFWKKIIF